MLQARTRVRARLRQFGAPPWSTRSKYVRPNANDPTKVIWNAYSMLKYPVPSSANADAAAVDSHGPTSERLMTIRNQRGDHKVKRHDKH